MGKLFLRNRLAYLAYIRHVVSQGFMQVEEELIWKQFMISNAGLQYQKFHHKTLGEITEI
jgi:hypothetical protein